MVGGGKQNNDLQVQEALVTWFQVNNSPATVQVAVDGLQSKFAKPAVTRVLEAMATEGKLSFKDFKKIRLYYLPQKSAGQPEGAAGGEDGPDQAPPESAGAEPEVSSLDQLAEINEKTQAIQQQLKAETQNLQRLKSMPSVAELQRLIQQQLAKKQQLHGQLATQKVLSAEEFKRETAALRELQRQHDRLRQTRTARKRILDDVLSSLAGEGSIQEVIQHLGLSPEPFPPAT